MLARIRRKQGLKQKNLFSFSEFMQSNLYVYYVSQRNQFFWNLKKRSDNKLMKFFNRIGRYPVTLSQGDKTKRKLQYVAYGVQYDLKPVQTEIPSFNLTYLSSQRKPFCYPFNLFRESSTGNNEVYKSCNFDELAQSKLLSTSVMENLCRFCGIITKSFQNLVYQKQKPALETRRFIKFTRNIICLQEEKNRKKTTWQNQSRWQLI